MKSVIEDLFISSYSKKCDSELAIKLESEIDRNKRWLKKCLSKNQKKLLLRIEDGKDMLNDINTTESFIAGFKIGLKIGVEVSEDTQLDT